MGAVHRRALGGAYSNYVSVHAFRLHPAVSYTLARIGIFVVAGAALYAVGFRHWALVFGALVISLPVSWFVLRKQRQAFGERIASHQAARREQKQKLRAALRGDD